MSDDDLNGRDDEDESDLDDAQLADLLRLVGRAFAEGDPPPPVDDDGMSYVRWSSPDADIGVMFERELEGVRDDGEAGGDLEFIGERFTISIGISAERIVGEVSPWEVTSTLRLEHASGPTEVEVDEDGEFYIASPPSGPVRLRVDSAGDAMVTEWFTITPSRSS